MTDINSGGNSDAPVTQPARVGFRGGAHAPSASDKPDDASSIALVELLFFAYRDFTGDADAMLAELGFGRAHHRVLHFVYRNPGLRVADLLDILKITKQSLARVLRQLVEEGYIDQKAGAADRRERLLHVTEKGATLVERLIALQSDRIRIALAAAGPETESAVERFLFCMIGADDRNRVAAMTGCHPALTDTARKDVGA